MDVLDEFTGTVLFPRSFPLIQSVTQAAKKILPGSVHTLIVRHAVMTMTEKPTARSKLAQVICTKFGIKATGCWIRGWLIAHFVIYWWRWSKTWWISCQFSRLHGERSKWTIPGRIFLVAYMTLSIDGNHLEKRTVDLWTTSNPLLKSQSEKIRNVIDLQPKIMEAIVAANGGHTNYMNCGQCLRGV